MNDRFLEIAGGAESRVLRALQGLSVAAQTRFRAVARGPGLPVLEPGELDALHRALAAEGLLDGQPATPQSAPQEDAALSPGARRVLAQMARERAGVPFFRYAAEVAARRR